MLRTGVSSLLSTAGCHHALVFSRITSEDDKKLRKARTDSGRPTDWLLKNLLASPNLLEVTHRPTIKPTRVPVLCGHSISAVWKVWGLTEKTGPKKIRCLTTHNHRSNPNHRCVEFWPMIGGQKMTNDKENSSRITSQPRRLWLGPS